MARPPARPRGHGFIALEAELRGQGYDLVAGVDEVGRGPLAGPVVAAAVLLDPQRIPPGLDDSKRLSPRRREELAPQIKATALGWGLGSCSPLEVDRLNIHRASLLAMQKAVEVLPRRPDFLLIDGRHLLALDLPQRAVVGGDGLLPSVAAASILAKVHRDAIMQEEHRRYPEYNFAANKGYGTAEHRRALALHGPCPLHRRSFRPVAQLSLELPHAG